jgi:hypothetical protein
MKFIFAILAWLVIGAVLGAGIWLLTAKGNPWLLAASAFCLVVAIGKIGCATH